MIAFTPGGRLPSGWAGRITSLSLILGTGRVIAAGVVEGHGPNDYCMFVSAQAFLCISGHDPAKEMRTEF
jgi:hypothetical protein